MVENEIDALLIEIAQALGGFEELKKKVEELKQLDDEAAFERFTDPSR